MALSITSTASAFDTPSTEFNLPLTVSEANAMIVLGLIANSSQTNLNPTAVWDSSGAASTLTVIGAAAAGRWTDAYYIHNPATGTHSVNIKWSHGSAGVVPKAAAAILIEGGVDSTTPYDTGTVSTATVDTSSAITAAAIASETGDFVIAVGGIDNTFSSAVSPTGGGTIDAGSPTSADVASVISHTDGAASVTVGFTYASAQKAGLIAFNVNAASGGGGGGGGSQRPRTRTLMGVGM